MSPYSSTISHTILKICQGNQKFTRFHLTTCTIMSPCIKNMMPETVKIVLLALALAAIITNKKWVSGKTSQDISGVSIFNPSLYPPYYSTVASTASRSRSIALGMN